MGNNDADKQVAIFSDILTSCVLNQFKILLGELGFLTEKLKKKNYYSKLSQKLSDKTNTTKISWSILETFLNVINLLLI